MSELRTALLSDVAGTGPATLTKQWAAKAYCLLDTVASLVRSSKNVSSGTDSGVGIWSLNLTSAMTSAYFSTASASYAASYTSNEFSWPLTASTLAAWCSNGSSAYADVSHHSVTVDGDLA